MAPFVEPGPAHEADLDDVIRDGLLLALAGVRMTVRNLMIVRALRDNKDYDETWFLDATLFEFHVLAAEKRADAARVAEYRTAAIGRPGRASHAVDYGSEDESVLERREAALIGLAERLDTFGDAEAGAVVDAAREAALSDITGAIRRSSEPSAEYSAARGARIDELTRDLAMLQLRNSGL
jgi:hypothetical protein